MEKGHRPQRLFKETRTQTGWVEGRMCQTDWRRDGGKSALITRSQHFQRPSIETSDTLPVASTLQLFLLVAQLDKDARDGLRVEWFDHELRREKEGVGVFQYLASGLSTLSHLNSTLTSFFGSFKRSINVYIKIFNAAWKVELFLATSIPLALGSLSRILNASLNVTWSCFCFCCYRTMWAVCFKSN